MKTNIIIIDAELLEPEEKKESLNAYDKRRFGRLVRQLIQME